MFDLSYRKKIYFNEYLSFSLYMIVHKHRYIYLVNNIRNL